jgi:DNA-binding Lrp family transcriptional regulator
MSNTKPDALSFHVTSLTEAQGVIERLQAEIEARKARERVLVEALTAIDSAEECDGYNYSEEEVAAFQKVKEALASVKGGAA